MSANKQQIRGAVIGYGGAFNMGRHHADQMKGAGIDFVAACELDPNRLQQAKNDFPHINAYGNLDEMLANPEIDLVTVITPHNTHADLANKVLDSGKNCIIEKPMCIDVNEAEALVQKAKQKGLMLSVFHNRRWDAWYLTVKDLLERDLIGDVFNVEMYFGGYGHPGTWWRSNKEISGGAFYDWGAHYVDWLLGIVPGKINSVRGFVQNRMWHDVTNEDHVDSIVSFDSGAVAMLQYSSISRANKVERRILGTKGAITSTGYLDPGFVTLYTEVNGIKVETKVPHLPSRNSDYYKNIAEYLRGEADLVVTAASARRVIAVLDTTGKSASEGRELVVPYEH